MKEILAPYQCSIPQDIAQFEGDLNGSSLKMGIVIAKFNDSITQRLLEGCLEGLRTCQVPHHQIQIHWVPGAFELAVAADHLLTKGLDVVICLGAIIQGDTAHFDYVCSGTTFGIQKVMIKHSKPVIFGVLTTQNTQQALDRTLPGNNKGFDFAITAVQMGQLFLQSC